MSDNFDEIVVPELTLTPLSGNTPAAAAESEITPVHIDDTQLTDAERAKIEEFAKQIDVKNSAVVLQYGAAAQKNIAEFSESALSKVRTKDMGEVGNMVSGLVVELKGFSVDSPEQQKGIRGLFKKSVNKVAEMKARYDKVEVNVDKIAGALEAHQVVLLKDIAMLDKMYDMNLAYFKELTMYILAGRKQLNKVETEDLPALKEHARKTGLPEDAQAANDLANMCNRFHKKLHDLELTRTVSIQMAPQIRLVQNNDSLMVEKIQSSLVNTIPLWKSQMVLALGIAHSNQAMQAQREVTDMTNELLRKNADTLKMGTIETARESERGIIDIETLQHTNRSLIETLDEVVKIQAEGREKRHAAEIELGRIEGELKQKLLELKA